VADMTVASCIYPLRFNPGAGYRFAGTGMTFLRRTFVVIKGVQQELPPTTVNFIGHIQQASVQAVMRLPEGDRSKDWIEVFSETALFTANVAQGRLADRVSYNGNLYDMMEIDDRTSDAVNANFYRGLAVKVGQ
jgi:hypothetical protein